MRLSLISFDFAEYTARLACGLSAHAEVDLFLPERQAAAQLHLLGSRVRFHAFPQPRLRHLRAQMAVVRDIVRSINQINPDVVHLQQGHMWFNLALPVIRQHCPVVLTVHDPRHHVGDRLSRKTPQFVMDFGFRQATEIITHGQQVKQMLVDACRLPATKIHVIPHHALATGAARKPESSDRPVVLFFGRIWKYKGLEYLIKAEPLITARIRDVVFVIAGEGEDLAWYRSMMAHPDRFVIRNEYVDDAERDELFRQASVVVLPYIEATQSGVAPVAYGFAKPVVASSVGALSEVVEHGRTGLLVPPADSQQLADALVHILLNPELGRRFGQNGKEKLQRECSIEVVAAKTMIVYDIAVAGQQARFQAAS
ncbi:MAG: glycosyltransferase family 4 protein [Terriglobales bacterium]